MTVQFTIGYYLIKDVERPLGGQMLPKNPTAVVSISRSVSVKLAKSGPFRSRALRGTTSVTKDDVWRIRARIGERRDGTFDRDPQTTRNQSNGLA